MVHQAGELREGLQRCDRCGYVLTDYRNAAVPIGTPPLRGWEAGAFVEVLTGYPKSSVLTDESPDCEVLQ